MKRFLSLVLTLVMVMSLVTVSAGAKDFTDDDSITYDEAVAVVSEVGIVDGYADGKFNPTNILTRQAAAKIICNLILGPTTAAELHADTAPYRDVPVSSEFAGYIAYCQAKGIISGYADGSFRPGNTLTGYAFMKMLLGALGYDANLEGYVGANWSINVAKQALGIGLNKGLVGDFNGIKAVTREEACLYAFNTLQADLVEYGQRLTTTVNGTEVTLSSGGAHAVKWDDRTQQTRYNTIRVDGVVQFAEEYFNLLVKSPDTDIFERPAHTWVYDKKIQIGTWVDKDKLLESYSDSVKARDLYNLLGSVILRDYELNVYVDGHVAGTGEAGEYQNQYTPATKEIAQFDNLTRSNDKTVGATGRGVLTEVYKDDEAEEIVIVSIHTWLAQATSTYSETREAATLKVFETSHVGTTKTVNVEDVPEVVDVTADTFYLVQMSDKETDKLEVVNIAEPEILEESTVTKFTTDNETDSKYPSKLTTNGNEYKKSNTAIYDADTLDLYDNDLLANNTYNVYLDVYGYFIGVDLFEGVKQYVFVTGYDMKNSNLSYKTAEAAGIFLDGTMDTMTVNVKDTNKNIEKMLYSKDASGNLTVPKDANAVLYYKKWATNASQGVYLLNRWYTYTKNEAGVYTLKPCVNSDGEAMMLAAKSANATESDNSAKTMKLNCARLRLDSVTSTEGLLMGESMYYATEGLDSYRAYGEDESVFITVDVEEVSAVANGVLPITKAITDVNGVYTGVQDVDMLTAFDKRVVGIYSTAEATNTAAIVPAVQGDPKWVGSDGTSASSTSDGKSYLGENAYAVFDKNNFIIGAVILGEAEGNNATKAYILDPVKYERYENGTYYWQFEAIIDGQKVTQEAESKYPDTITTMREHQYEIVELRYKDDGETVTDVKEIDRRDTAANTKLDKIYGNPFLEIKNHAVDTDKESIYDVVLTGVDNATEATNGYLDRNGGSTGVEFWKVTRPANGGKVFAETELGKLNLQGRTLWVLGAARTASNDADYGIDFVKDAKGIVIQPEGTTNDNDLETRVYDSVAEAIDSLSDSIDPTTPVKEFRGIITAVLNGQGVAEWIVFFSDTLLDTRASVNPVTPGGGNGFDNRGLPTTSEVPVTLSGGLAGQGRIRNGKLYLDFSNLPATATEVEISAISITAAGRGLVTYPANFTVKKEAGQNCGIAVSTLPYELLDGTTGLTVAGTETATKIPVDNSNIKLGADVYPVTGPAEIAADATTYKVTVNKPAGAVEWTLQSAAGTNVTAANVVATEADKNGANANSAISSAITYDCDSVELTFTLTAAGTKPVPAVTVAVTEWEYSVDTSSATVGNGITLVRKASGAVASLTHNTSETVAVEVVLDSGVAAADDKVVVAYTVNGTPAASPLEITLNANDATASDNISVTATKKTAIVVTSVKLQKNLTAAGGAAAAGVNSMTSTNLTAAAKVKVFEDAACTTQVTAAKVFDVGTTLYVQVSGGTVTAGKHVDISVKGVTSATSLNTDLSAPAVIPVSIGADFAGSFIASDSYKVTVTDAD